MMQAQISKRFKAIARIEPALIELERKVRDHAKANAGAEAYCANENWYGPRNFRAAVVRLVGWEATNPMLRNPNAYDVAYDYLYSLLPDCRHDDGCRG